MLEVQSFVEDVILTVESTRKINLCDKENLSGDVCDIVKLLDM